MKFSLPSDYIRVIRFCYTIFFYIYFCLPFGSHSHVGFSRSVSLTGLIVPPALLIFPVSVIIKNFELSLSISFFIFYLFIFFTVFVAPNLVFSHYDWTGWYVISSTIRFRK